MARVPVAAPRHRTRSTVPLAALIRPLLVPPPAARVKARLAELDDALRTPALRRQFAGLLSAHPPLGAFLAGVMEYSPFLRALMVDDPQRLLALLAADPEARLKRLAATASRAWRASDEAALMTALRRARQEVALLVALADLGGVIDVVATTAALTAFADAAVGAAVNFLLAAAHRAGQLALPDPASPAEGSGWIVLAMGKFGAGELNYSSDIDLIVLYDEEAAALAGVPEPGRLFVRLTQRLVRILQERTADSYVFRTDLRLRPDPGATSIALSTAAALQYYESQGQNWERAALIKARAVAGDIVAGETFLADLTPYIWRKYLDYAAIADIHSIKRQIHDFRGH